jgi:hypothetical protein
MVYEPLNFSGSSKGIIRNSNASRIWKGEIAHIAICFERLLLEAFFIHQIQSTISRLLANQMADNK